MNKACGLDVHKDSVFLCILSDTGEKIEKVFGVLTTELEAMRDLIVSNGVEEVGMESTSIYWEPVWNILEDSLQGRLKLINPYFIRQLPGHKSDVKDAQWIAECILKGLVNGSYVPDEPIRRLRLYDRRIFDLDKEIVRKLAKLDAELQRCNIRLSNYVSNTDCKSYTDVVDMICDGETDPNELVKHIHGRIINRHSKETITDSLKSCVSEADVDVMRQLRQEIELARSHKQECIDKMNKICQENYSEELALLTTMPGIKQQSATSLIAEIGTDMGKFETANHLSSWSGLKPRNDQSNKTMKSRRITHGNRFLRQTIIQCAWAASRTKNCHFSRFSFYQTQVRKKNKLKVLVAVARKLLVCIWHILSAHTAYKDFGVKVVEKIITTS